MTVQLLTDELGGLPTQGKKQNSFETRVVRGEETEEMKDGLENPGKGR